MRFGIFSLILAAGVAAYAKEPSAQGQLYGFGRTATADDFVQWGIIVGPKGDELPSGSGTAREGAPLYARKCAYCHGPTGAEPFMHWMRDKPWTAETYCCFPAPLVGHEDSLTTLIPVKSVGAYWVAATTLWDYINRAMPPDEHFRSVRGYEFAQKVNEEGPLTADDVYALTAFILAQNKIIGVDDVMNADTLPQVKMPGRRVMIPENPVDWSPGAQLDPHISPTLSRRSHE